MKTAFATFARCAVSLAVFTVAAPPAVAVPPSYRTLQGEVTAVEPDHKRLTMRTEKTPAGLSLVWGPHTEFFRDGKLADAAALRRGQRVTVRYRHPFSGPLYAGRVFILPAKK